MQKAFVIRNFGSGSETARALRIKPPSVSKWPEELPDSAVGRIARLRPDALRAWWKEQRKHRQAA
ncbi:hypothetical protein FNU76_06225 [Chitinimonas arctica]|uniref:Helix-turn-helix domain-containing protein n=1 Tax=Chitinimonas arctica TaxID=2594795 RepID=A0A516SCU9_9NEIS|nr:Cro/CI family transcriptional regulator [Chitinimonas arctica]QDQ25979.1 hypothetical protein FNU76_06225 [Chitinimonas arctica]